MKIFIKAMSKCCSVSSPVNNRYISLELCSKSRVNYLHALMNIFLQVLFVTGAIIVLILLVYRPGKSRGALVPLPDYYRQLLNEHVSFYHKLDDEGKRNFEQKVEKFFTQVRIVGVNTSVDDIDRVLIGASAIIPIYAFPDWEYVNLHEVLLYPEAFTDDFEQEGYFRPVAGMVGTGAMQHVMILSKVSLRQSFMNNTGTSNTAIHEFVHLIDKMDGTLDGVPEVLFEHQYTIPWLNMIRENMQAMSMDQSEINSYGLLNPAEFFAVVSEYFFTQPELLQANHPELYAMLEKMFLRKKDDES